MRAVIQRVTSASIRIDRKYSGSIGPGLVVFLGVMEGDTSKQMLVLSEKIAGLRIFKDEEGKMNRSVQDIGGQLLIVSNFTLGADCRKGKRPSFIASARPEEAIPLYEAFVEEMRKCIPTGVLTGKFGADMEVSLVNDGPVTIWLDTDELHCK